MYINNIHDAISEYVNTHFKNDFMKTHPTEHWAPTSSYYDERTKQFTSSRTKGMFSIYYSLSPELCDGLKKNFGSGWPKCAMLQMERYGDNPHNLKYAPTQIEEITLSGFIEFLEQRADYISENTRRKLLRKLKPNYVEEELEQIWKTFNLREVSSYPLFKLDNTERELLHCLFMLKYEQLDINDVIRYSRQDHREDFPEDLLEKGIFSNNRLFLPSEDEGQFTVISKNPYDYIWCSTGNGYQSCFSLESGYWGIQALPLLATQSWHFMVYTTNAFVEDFSLFNHKFRLPNIKCRCWMYRTEDGYMMDKMYGKPNWNSCNMEDAMMLLGIQKESNGYQRSDAESDDWDESEVDYIRIDKKDNDWDLWTLYARYNTYCDSINPDTEGYLYDVGTHKFTLSGYYHGSQSPKGYINGLQFNKDLVWNPDKKLRAGNGTIGYFNLCEKTGLPIGDNEKEHWAAKYLDKAVRSLIIVTVDDTPSGISTMRYIVSDGSVLSPREPDNEGWFGRKYGCFNDAQINNLSKFKDLIRKTQNEDPQYDCVLLRIINKNKVTFQPFYAKKESRL